MLYRVKTRLVGEFIDNAISAVAISKFCINPKKELAPR